MGLVPFSSPRESILLDLHHCFCFLILLDDSLLSLIHRLFSSSFMMFSFEFKMELISYSEWKLKTLLKLKMKRIEEKEKKVQKESIESKTRGLKFPHNQRWVCNKL